MVGEVSVVLPAANTSGALIKELRVAKPPAEKSVQRLYSRVFHTAASHHNDSIRISEALFDEVFCSINDIYCILCKAQS